jgi:hypothetical protein
MIANWPTILMDCEPEPAIVIALPKDHNGRPKLCYFVIASSKTSRLDAHDQSADAGRSSERTSTFVMISAGYSKSIREAMVQIERKRGIPSRNQLHQNAEFGRRVIERHSTEAP